MDTVGQIEKKAQKRVIKLFSDRKYPCNLGYDYLGDWAEREGNCNIEDALLRKFLHEKKADADLARGGAYTLDKARLYVGLDKGMAKIVDAKAFRGENPNGFVLDFKLDCSDFFY